MVVLGILHSYYIHTVHIMSLFVHVQVFTF